MEDVIEYKNLNKDEVQNRIYKEIAKINQKTKNISEQGYNLYLRDETSDIYKIENTENFLLGNNNYLYLIYAYGNNEFTSQMDLVIF